MTDRELLELAAKAAGMSDWGYAEKWGFMSKIRHSGGFYFDTEWNPLTDDGDALRLAVKLNFGISIPVHKTVRADVICFLDSSVNIREENGDPYAATRRAIVRAAAESGRQMGGSDD